jgi:hypothetical protein
VIQSDASLVFANASDFGETATYKPKLYSEGDARPNRSIVVVIDRQAFEVVSEDQQTATPVWEIQVVNSLGNIERRIGSRGRCVELSPEGWRSGDRSNDHEAVRT